MRRTTALLAALWLAPGVASAAPLMTLTDFPSGNVTAGASFTLTIRLDDAVDLFAYTIPLLVNGPAGSTPGVSFDFDPLPPVAASDYVFGAAPTGNYLATKDTNIAGFPQRAQLTVGDFLNATPGVTTGPGNNVIAVVTVTTDPGFTGPLIFSLTTELPFELLDSNLEEIPGTILGGPVTVNVVPGGVVPEPATFALALGGLATLGGRRLLSRRRRSGRSVSRG
jgi:hypothetical protein